MKGMTESMAQFIGAYNQQQQSSGSKAENIKSSQQSSGLDHKAVNSKDRNSRKEVEKGKPADKGKRNQDSDKTGVKIKKVIRKRSLRRIFL